LIGRQAQMDAVHDVLDTKVNEKPFEDTQSFGGHGLTMLDPTKPDRNAIRWACSARTGTSKSSIG